MDESGPTPSAPIVITMGDPAGIGPEIVAKLAGDETRLVAPFVVIGDVGIMRRAAKIVGADIEVLEVTDALAPPSKGKVLCVIQAGPRLPAELAFGQVDARAGATAYRAVEIAIKLAMSGQISGIVTAPINKEAMREAGYHYPGHTEILAEQSGTKDFAMMLANDELRVLLVTIHVSLEQAIQSITKDAELRAIRLAADACRSFGIKNPRVAVAGLNPHAGENGLFGRQDLEIIAPAIAEAKATGIEASGPWPGDTVFMRARKGEFDVVVAQYHDQGLIPIKYLGIDSGVNITVGLPFVRTSVDHGTAFDIAGTGRADHTSLAYALRQAVALMGARRRLADAESLVPKVANGPPNLIFMLTRNDATVPDAQDRLAEVLDAGIRHIGFKDVGLPFEQLSDLTQQIRVGRAAVYFEVVSVDAQSEIASAHAAVALGVDVLMGGTRPEAVLPIIRGAGIQYYPFCGQVVGHPSVLGGTTEEIVTSAKRIASLDGVDGLDLLAYRFHGDVPDLITKVCTAVHKNVVVAGSIDRAERIAAVIDGGAAGFTIGTAALDGVFPAESSGLPAQLRSVALMFADALCATRGRWAGTKRESMTRSLRKIDPSEPACQEHSTKTKTLCGEHQIPVSSRIGQTS